MTRMGCFNGRFNKGSLHAGTQDGYLMPANGRPPLLVAAPPVLNGLKL